MFNLPELKGPLPEVIRKMTINVTDLRSVVATVDPEDLEAEEVHQEDEADTEEALHHLERIEVRSGETTEVEISTREIFRLSSEGMVRVMEVLTT